MEQPSRPASELITEIRAALEGERIDPDGVGPLKALRELEELFARLKRLSGLRDVLAREHPNRPPVK